MKYKYNEDRALLSSKNWQNEVPSLLRLGVAAKTSESYDRRVRKFISFAKRTKEGFTKKGFIRFVVALFLGGASGTTIDGYRAGILFFQRSHDLIQFCADPDVTQLTASLRLWSKKRAVQRGGLTLSMLEELCSLNEQYAFAFRAAFFGCLRLQELQNIRGGDLRQGESGDVLFLRRNKRQRRTKTGLLEPNHPKREIFFVKEFRLAVIPLQNVFGHGEPLFSWIQPGKMRDLIKQAKRRFGWPKGIKWDGGHCCRHGGAQLRKRHLAINGIAADVFASMAPATNAHYGRANEMRK